MYFSRVDRENREIFSHKEHKEHKDFSRVERVDRVEFYMPAAQEETSSSPPPPQRPPQFSIFHFKFSIRDNPPERQRERECNAHRRVCRAEDCFSRVDRESREFF